MQILKTARLTLEPQVALHAEEMFRILSDPALYEHENEPPPSAEWLRQRFIKLESRRSPDGAEQWLNWVIRHPSAELIGYVQATVYQNSTAAIAYVFSSKFWGQGFATEAVQAMLTELIDRYNVRCLSAVLKRSNLPSLRLLERVGFSLATSQETERASVEQDEILMLRVLRRCP